MRKIFIFSLIFEIFQIMSERQSTTAELENT